LHSYLAGDQEAQKVFLKLCLEKPQIAFDTLFWTYNPREIAGKRNIPFVLRPAQEDAVSTITRAINEGFDVGINKSRDEGATEIVTKMFILFMLLVPETTFIVGSRKEEYVDKTGDPKSIFAKLDYGLKHLPNWLALDIERTHLHMRNRLNESVIDGEATNENFGAGARATAILLDEFGRVDGKLAENIRDTVSDVTECVIYNSTHFYGTGHAFNKVLHSKKIKVVVLPWYQNPVKAKGLYKSPEGNVIEIIDIDYYRKIAPEIFNTIKPNVPIKYNDFVQKCRESGHELEKYGIHFVADGCIAIPGDRRSPWHDQQEERRTRRDLSQNVWMSPIGSANMFFDSVVNDSIRSTVMRPPDYTGEIVYKFNSLGKINRKTVLFKSSSGKRRLHWWGKLKNGRPNQLHNYTIGCDISLGTGASNSVAAVEDVNTSELVGIFACPNTSPENFADYVVALAYWVGGKVPAFICWENNGGHGTNFGRRIIFNGYGFVYTGKTEQAKVRKAGRRFGWHSNREAKEDLLTELRIAIAEGLKTNPKHTSIKIYSEDVLDELDRYIFYENGDIGFADLIDTTSGARARHGDRVIAVALSVLGRKEQPKARKKFESKLVPYSIAWLRWKRLEKERNLRDIWRDK